MRRQYWAVIVQFKDQARHNKRKTLREVFDSSRPRVQMTPAAETSMTQPTKTQMNDISKNYFKLLNYKSVSISTHTADR